MKPEQQKALQWLAHGETGTSSKTMCMWLAFDIRMRNAYHPLDPDDLDRCLQLLDEVPEFRNKLPQMGLISEHWQALAIHWDTVEQCHLEEVGLGWSKARSAPRTFKMMQDIYLPCELRSKRHRL